ncbi:kinesin-domain-containing protein [Lichtheimia hyalospora FSU 10163]|nr:kinesin-domain-containing protein [Lichtheimia hyalospora FSU 10163]
MAGGGNIKVVVRCRPLNARELARGATGLIRMEGNQTILSRPPDSKTGKESEDIKAFTFDKSYWSADKNAPNYADQQTVYNDLGEDLLNHAFDGYNCCIFAYGQTGSGKSYSMMGYGDDHGITPRTCSELFERIKANDDENLTYRVEVSYIEIYNEKVRDLLNPKNKGNLKVREHPSTGPYVEDLSRLVVKSFDDINHLMDEGNKARTVAATNMNETSSRSHAVFTLHLTQKRKDELTKLETEKVARISLVDLAGSERANSTGATGARLKEGANINRSLTTLGKVIAGLAEQSMNEGKKKKKEAFIPYRDSVLTWLLKDSLGGNSKTAMIAAISPADYDETLSTLRYADQAKKIRNKAVVNEDPNAKMIRELKDELEVLRDRLRTYAPEEVEQLTAKSSYKNNDGKSRQNSTPVYSKAALNKAQQQLEIEITDSQGTKKKMTRQEIVDQLQSSEKLLANLNETWEEKLKKTEQIHVEREKALEELGIAVHKNNVGVYAPKKMPHLVNLNEDPLMSECLMYQIKHGITKVGRDDSDDPPDIRLSGSNIQDGHCYFENSNGVVTIHPNGDSVTMVNGMRISEPRRLRSGYRIILGDYHIFRFNHPEEVRRERGLQKTAVEKAAMGGNSPSPTSDSVDHDERPGSPTETASMIGSEIIDWNYARREAVLKYYANESNFGDMKDEDLEKLYDDITRIRNNRRTTRSESRTDNYDDDSSGDSYRNSMSVATVLNDGLESVCTETTVHSELEEKFRVEKEKLQKELVNQKRNYEAEITRMSRQFSQQLMTNGTTGGYTERQIALARKVAAQWKGLRYVAMAEVVLTNAVMLKEANIISRELNKDVLYQFTIIEDGQFSNPMSYWETTSALHQFETDEDTTLISTPKPCIGVRVIDRKHQVLYVWSLERLKLRLHKMRNLYNFVDRPMYRSHFNWEDPFFEDPCPKYSFIGSASTSIRNLALQQPYESNMEIICRTTGQIKGMLRAIISPIARSVAIKGPEARLTLSDLVDEEVDHEDDQVDDDGFMLRVGQQLLFEIRLVELTGIIDADYQDVHVQFKLSSFGGIPEHSTAEKVFATDPISDFENGPIRLDHSQTISLVVTRSVMDVLMQGMISFEIFGVAQNRVLSQHERWDDQREKPRLADLLAANRPMNGSSSTLSNGSTTHRATSDQASIHSNHTANGTLERRSEEELLAAERHDVLSWAQICELSPNGDYVPVPVTAHNALDRGVFTLRQGLQRRICLTLSHTSGRQFEWSRISRASVGRVRLLDPKGRIIDAPAHDDIPIKLLSQQNVVYNNDGTSQLTAQGAWDSSQHECLFLNRITAHNTRILLNLRWEIEAAKCSKPVQFSMDIAVRIHGRDGASSGTRSRLRKLLGASTEKQLPKCSAMFLVHLRPPMTRRLSQLWRLNTVSKYVRGEEYLGSWRPRGVSLVNDYKHIRERIRRKEAVAFTAQVLTLQQQRKQPPLAIHGASSSSAADADDALSERQTALAQKVLDLWKQKYGTLKEIVISQDPPIPGMPDFDLQQEERDSSKLLAEVKLVTQSDNVSKRGYLTYQESAVHDKWIKLWFVVRRPYIYIYTDQSETDEQGVINISSVRIDYNQALEQMIERSNVFALYTSNNAYTLQASSRADMIDWISKIDQMFPIEKLKNDTL